jgi:hypothetical protein
MNKRLKELMLEAGYAAPEIAGRGQLLAELIVRECARLCEHESNDDEYDQYDMGQSVKAESIKTAIKQHFGVEE